MNITKNYYIPYMLSNNNPPYSI